MVVCVFVYQRKEFIGHMVFTFNRVHYCCNAVWNGWSLCCQQLSVMMSVFPTLFHTYIFKNFVSAVKYLFVVLTFIILITTEFEYLPLAFH